VIGIRKAGERGRADHGWLQSWHSFSFADYHEPRFMGFGPLRVLNDDTVAPGQGFGMHGHRDMDIITWVLSGALEHQDTLGTGAVIRPGDVQRMSAGTGVHHSEFNHSTHEPVHFLQIWLVPAVNGIEPSYEQKHFPPESLQGRLCLLASPDGSDDSVRVNEAARLYAAVLGEGERVEHVYAAGRLGYIHVATGSATVAGQALAAGDAAMLQDEPGALVIEGGPAQILLFDLPR
jgi:redox-sensitive bicupin YhaK (pirin superfamily)